MLNGVTGAAGLRATLAALEAGFERWPLANKESLIVGGPLVTSLGEAGADRARSTPSTLDDRPVRLRAGANSEVKRLVLTASGGPFRGWAAERLASVTPKQALAHPTWNMGPLVTTNSATLVNKGLEVIEAHLLFGFGLDRIDVVVPPAVDRPLDGGVRRRRDDHPGEPARTAIPIALGLAWPDRVADAAPEPGLDDGRDLDVRAARRARVPLRRSRWRQGGRPARRHRARRSTTAPMRRAWPISWQGKDLVPADR